MKFISIVSWIGNFDLRIFSVYGRGARKENEYGFRLGILKKKNQYIRAPLV
jgi:hypothetical protein